MNSTRPRPIARVSVLGLAMAFLRVPGGLANAQDFQHLTTPQPGGMPGWPVMTEVTQLTNGLSVTWDGPSGYYQLYQKPSLKAGSWQAVGSASLLRQAILTASSSSGFFRVLGPSPIYAGDGACTECHGSALLTEISDTPHAQAFQILQQSGQAANPAVLPSYTVGYGLPTGFSSAAATPGLEGVQCENCHGPAANHAANEFDPSVLPRVELAATVCGGCHRGPQQPYYDEWTTSAHSQVPGQSVIPDMNAANVIDACGQCHSGSARLSLLYAEPAPTGDADMPVVCAVCHDPHAEHTYANALNGVYTFTNLLTGDDIVISNNQLGAVYTQQLLNPLASTNDYFVPDGTTIASQYNPNINLCAQCHNDRGASWTNSSEPPHPSLQYNMLLGTVGVLASGPTNLPGTHSQLEKQCVACHMQTSPYQSAAQPAITGHSFKVQLYDVCTPCHGSGQGQGLVQLLNLIVSNQVSQVKASLDYWATNTITTNFPSALRSYGTRAWEYATPGGLSSGGPGPTANLQTNIPVNIQKARFNLYAVYNDGSGGVHNPFYVLSLLSNAEAWVQQQLP
ncbi:MAG: cytochrome c family protein [Verrucomicrobiota bacterium]